MTEEKRPAGRIFITDGYQATSSLEQKGHQAVSALPKVTGGHQGQQTSQLKPPPSGGSSSGK